MIGNLPETATKAEITKILAPFGKVNFVKIIMNRRLKKPSGFSLVMMNFKDLQVIKDIQKLNGKEEIGGNDLNI